MFIKASNEWLYFFDELQSSNSSSISQTPASSSDFKFEHYEGIYCTLCLKLLCAINVLSLFCGLYGRPSPEIIVETWMNRARAMATDVCLVHEINLIFLPLFILGIGNTTRKVGQFLHIYSLAIKRFLCNFTCMDTSLNHEWILVRLKGV